MKTIRSRKITKAIFAVLVLLVSAPSLSAYPPDNAAVLYYKAFMLYERDHEIKLWDYFKGNIKSNEKIEEFLKKNRRIIDIVLDATRIDHCDWGLDYSQGTEVLLPPHYQAREIFTLLAVEARMQADRGDYRKALGRSMSIYRMARHLNERPIVCYIVSKGINSTTNKYIITQFLSEMPQNTETLTWLRNELTKFSRQPISVKPSLRWKREAAIISMSPERIGRAVEYGLADGPTKKKSLERIHTADKQFFAKNIAYWNGYMDSVEAVFDLPYLQGYAKIKKLEDELSEDFATNPNATLTACLEPGFLSIYISSVRSENGSNAVRAAIEIYLIKAATGSLPKTLPKGVPGDLYSGKPFQYVKTADGFILRCQGRDLNRDEVEIYEYEFKTPK